MEYLVNILLLSNAYVDDINSFLIKSGYSVKSGFNNKVSTRQNKDVPAVLLSLIVGATSDNIGGEKLYNRIVSYCKERSINYYYLLAIEHASNDGKIGLGSIKEAPKKVKASTNKSNVLIFPIKNNDKPVDVMDDEEAKKLAQKQLEQKEIQPKPDKELQ